jgi:predicted HicB family RNase H-like nuclease
LIEEDEMDTSIAMTRLETAVEQQVLISGSDPEFDAMATTLLATLEPVVKQIALDLAEQAAAEVSAQLAGTEIEVVMSEGEPSLRVRSVEGGAEIGSESLDARITLRLPPTLKERVEVAADEVGESVNSWLVSTLAAHASERSRRIRRRITGTIET